MACKKRVMGFTLIVRCRGIRLGIGGYGFMGFNPGPCLPRQPLSPSCHKSIEIYKKKGSQPGKKRLHDVIRKTLQPMLSRDMFIKPGRRVFFV